MKSLKKIITVMLICSMVLATFSIISVAAGSLKGDVNSDGSVNSKDSLLLKKYLANWDVVINTDAADVNCDGTINSKDSLYLKQVIANVITITSSSTVETTTTSEIQIPSNYPNALNTKVAINQIGYRNDSNKVAKLNLVDYVEKTAVCYVVNADTNDVVFQGITTSKRYDSVTEAFVSNFDFSSITKSGKYYIHTPIGYSYSFEIKDNPYNTVENSMITALYYNRCGSAIDSSIVGDLYAHSACHVGGAKVIKLGGEIEGTIADCTGGLHDAGDYGRYVTPANQVVADLLYSTELFPNATSYNIITDNNGESIPDTLDEARYEVKWLLKMQDQTSGGVYWRVATPEFVKYGDAPDEDSFFNQSGLYASRVMLKSTAGFVGATAAAYRVFKNIDPNFALQCLNASKKAYNYVLANMNDPKAHDMFTSSSENNVVKAGDYGSANAWSDIWWAACELYRATGEETYNNDVKSLVSRKELGEISFNYNGITATEIGGVGSMAYLLADGADETIKQKVITSLKSSTDSFAGISSKDKYNVVLLVGTYYWGSNQLICDKLKTMAFVDHYMGTNSYDGVIRDNISYIFGANAVSECYITGFGSQSPQNICHAPSTHVQVKHDTVSPAPGFMVGGASETGSFYEDVQNNYACNEVCVYWNSSIIFALASIVDDDIN